MLRLAALLVCAAIAAGQPPKTDTHQIKIDGHTFTLPKGFTVERVAGPPLVDRPIVASFDDRGRLYVADSSGSNEKVTEQLKNPTHRIVRLEDSDGDGKFDKSVVFADKMMFPEGILWHRGAVYVAAPPHIWKLTDTDDDGKADKREIWFDGKTLTGCANDLHGPYLGPDGWLYWAKGAFAKQEYTLPNGKKFTTRAAHIFRARPDGTGIEPVMTGGMDNPVDVAFLPNGERFFTTTFFQHPAAGLRDGLIHAVYGGIYGKDQDAIYDPDHKWTSPHLMPVMTHMGPAAPCGLHCYESTAFGPEYKSNLFACQFNLRKVSRHVLKPHGSTYGTEDSDFLVSDNTDFHPTDVIEDADGSLLVVDTGGWYKLCCPSSQLVKADVLGAIYRVRKVGAKTVDDPRGLKTDWKKAIPAQLVRLVGDDRPSVRHRAVEELAIRDDGVLESLCDAAKKGQSSLVRQNALWALVRRPTPNQKVDEAPMVLTLIHALSDHDPGVRQVAMHATAVRRDGRMSTWVVANLFEAVDKGRLIEARIAAEALGRVGLAGTHHPNVTTVEAAILKLDKVDDPVLLHSLIYALIEIGDVTRISAFLDIDDPRVRRACLAALDQLGEKLDPKVVLAAMKSPDTGLKQTAQWIAGRHPEWADQMAGVFREQLAAAKPADRDALVAHLARLSKTPGIQKLLAATVTDAKASDAARITAMKSMAQAALRPPPDAWYAALEELLSPSASKDVALAALATLRAFPAQKQPSPTLSQRLKVLWGSGGSPEVALGAMVAFPGRLTGLKPIEIDLLRSGIHADMPPVVRGLTADVLAKANLDRDQLEAIIEQLPRVSPLDLDRVLGVFAQTKDERIGLKLVVALNAPAVRPALRADGVKERIKHFSPAVQREAEKLYALLNADYEHQRAKLEETSKALPAGDVRRGQAVFNNTKTACIACHTVGYVGGKQGPDLTRIGGIRTERDLLESILFPSASFVRSYESVIVTTRNGQTFSGVPKKDAPDEIVLVLAADKEIRIPREDVEEVRPGKVSIMPDGLDKQLTAQELADLIAFLRACK